MVTEITRPVMERKIRPQKEVALNCPRCHSTNTKFCYYNNYSLTQPRYFCKTCRRYWTEGGTLRNVPVGGGSRKNTSTRKCSTSPSLSMLTPDQKPTIDSPAFSSHQNPKIHDDHLNLGFQVNIPVPDYNNHEFLGFPKIEGRGVINNSSSALNFVNINAAARSGGLNSFFPMAPTYTLENTANNALYAFQECKPSLAFSIDAGINNNNNNNNNNNKNINGSSLMFALGATKRHDDSTTNIQAADHQEKGHQNSNGFWNGMLGGGGSW
ncbi:hypothetical protein DH2020_006228 [Rehmannia glutinosa]|uniref:Dof zinc finger protein n=1 Tax=Rehmannia glutinosa TaxID=99300 RepID=A0ABR0XI91_REHGL